MMFTYFSSGNLLDVKIASRTWARYVIYKQYVTVSLLRGLLVLEF